MSKSLTIGNETFLYAEQGTAPGWGECATNWACAVTTTLATLSGVNDINTTEVGICNDINACNPCPCKLVKNIGSGVSALSFSNASVRSFLVNYNVTRGSCCCVVEAGEMEGVYDGTVWDFSHNHVGCAGMDFQVTSSGVVQYFSDCGTAGNIKFRARTIDQ